MAANFTGQVIDNVLLSRIDAPIGTYRQSDLTLEQFLDETPGQWVLADGQSCEGSAYASKTGKNNVPDLRGSFMRTKDHGKGNDAERDLGNYQSDALQGHFHNWTFESTSMAGGGGLAPWNTGLGSLTTNELAKGSRANYLTDGVNGTPRVGNETRPKNVTVNTFIKIGY